jgi:hypothetical protein
MFGNYLILALALTAFVEQIGKSGDQVAVAPN